MVQLSALTHLSMLRVLVRVTLRRALHLLEHTKKSAAASLTEQRSRSLCSPGVPHRNIALRGHRRSVSAASIAGLGSVSAYHTRTQRAPQNSVRCQPGSC